MHKDAAPWIPLDNLSGLVPESGSPAPLSKPLNAGDSCGYMPVLGSKSS